MTTILVIIILVVIYLIFDGRREDHRAVQHQGGMMQKYKLLIEFLMDGPNARIEKVHNNTVVFSVTTNTTKHSFKLFHHINKLSVEWKCFSPIAGEQIKRWEFLENVDQIEMAQYIKSEIEEATGVKRLMDLLRNKAEENFENKNKSNRQDLDLPF